MPDDLKDVEYLGDGLYIGWDGHQTVVYESNGVRATASLYFGISELNSFVHYLKKHYDLDSLEEK